MCIIFAHLYGFESFNHEKVTSDFLMDTKGIKSRTEFHYQLNSN